MTATYLQKRWQKRQWNNVKDSAGPRYTSEVDVELPIRGLFEGLGRTKEFFDEVKDLKTRLQGETKDLNKRGKHYHYDVQDRIPKIYNHSQEVIKTLREISKDSSLLLPFHEIPPRVNWIFQHIRAIRDVIYKQEEKEKKEYEEAQKARRQEQEEETPVRISYRQDSDYLSSLKFLREDLRKLSGVLREIDSLSKDIKASLANDPFVLLLGEAGMGKTHLLCDVAKDRLSKNYPTIIVLGEEMPKVSSSVKAILKPRNISRTETSFLREINEYGKRKRHRVLLVVDAINESDIKGWKKNLRKFKKQIKKYPWVGVVLSCRTPFENIILPKNLKISKEYHHGFSDYEFEAMKAFFRHYRIPLPEVPVLISEFNSPLFLSSFCRTAVSLRGGRRKVAKKVKDIALGQTGMTTIFEDFYISKQSDIFRGHANEFNGIVTEDWLWSKTSGKKCLAKFFAKTMAKKKKEFLTLDEALDTIKLFLEDAHNTQTYKEILDMLVQYGVIIKDLAYISEDSRCKEVIKFPFQKFSDHLIARYFLENHLRVHRPRKSLLPNSPLGELFKDTKSLYARANLAEAIIVEFPERIKRNKRAHNKDIIDYIGKEIKNSPIFRKIYLNALYWRKPDNFKNANGHIKGSIIDYFNKTLLCYRDSSKALLDLFITTAVKPRHPLSYVALSNWLDGMTMPRRDVFWTEYLRSSYESDPIYRLISWIEEHDISKMSEEHATAIITTLSWFLTTTSHLLRNRTTKCIYIVGSIHPKICFEQTLRTLSIDDPYIKERMLASAYGVVMRFSSMKDDKDTNEHIAKFAEQFFDSFFVDRAKYSSTHMYIRNYVRGIIELALHKKLISLSKTKIAKIRPPYTQGGIRRWGRSDDANEGQYRDGNAPLGMDFTNYTLGCLIENRRNYDFENKEYKKVKENILWRIYQLGYSLEKFGDIDKQIVSSQRLTRSDYPTKVDRYGKKYSWIAYYELMGFRRDRKLINPLFGGDVYRENENDIDPSFPLLWLEKYPVKTNLLNGPRKMERWLKESPLPNISRYTRINLKSAKDTWVLMEGTLGQLNESTAKKNSIFIEGIFVSKKDKSQLIKFLRSAEYLGNDVIPDLMEVRWEYLGELGWYPSYNKPEEVLEAKFVTSYKKIKLSKKEKEFRSIRFILGGEEIIPAEPTKVPEYRDDPIYSKITIRRPARYCNSKDYRHLGVEDGLGLYVPSNSIIKILNLHKDPDTFNFLDKDEGLATISFVEGGPYKTHKNLLYIRKDLFEKLKKKYKKDFFLCAWGERQYWPKDLGLIHRSKYSAIYQKRENLHRQFISF